MFHALKSLRKLLRKKWVSPNVFTILQQKTFCLWSVTCYHETSFFFFVRNLFSSRQFFFESQLATFHYWKHVVSTNVTSMSETISNPKIFIYRFLSNLRQIILSFSLYPIEYDISHMDNSVPEKVKHTLQLRVHIKNACFRLI